MFTKSAFSSRSRSCAPILCDLDVPSNRISLQAIPKEKVGVTLILCLWKKLEKVYACGKSWKKLEKVYARGKSWKKLYVLVEKVGK